MGGIPDNYDELVGKALRKAHRPASEGKEPLSNRLSTVSSDPRRIPQKSAVEQKNATLQVMLKLDELCVLRRRNPIRLTSTELRSIGVSANRNSGL